MFFMCSPPELPGGLNQISSFQCPIRGCLSFIHVWELSQQKGLSTIQIQSRKSCPDNLVQENVWQSRSSFSGWASSTSQPSLDIWGLQKECLVRRTLLWDSQDSDLLQQEQGQSMALQPTYLESGRHSCPNSRREAEISTWLPQYHYFLIAEVFQVHKICSEMTIILLSAHSQQNARSV